MSAVPRAGGSGKRTPAASWRQDAENTSDADREAAGPEAASTPGPGTANAPGSDASGSGATGSGAADASGSGTKGAPARGLADAPAWGAAGWDAAAVGSGKSRRGAKAGPPDDPEAAAREICLRLLSFSPRTRAQLADALRRKGVPDDVAERVLGRYTEVGLIDDVAFSRAWVQSRHTGRGLARRALAAELRRRGVDDETVNEAVDELDPAQEEAAARELVAKRMAATRGLDSVKRTRRILGVLARKGYPGSMSYRLIREAMENEGLDDLPDGPQDD